MKTEPFLCLAHGPLGRPDGEAHSLTYPVSMKNVTIAIDDAVLREARRVAAERSTSLNALTCEFLERLAVRESRSRAARVRIGELCRESSAEVGERHWIRDDLHER